MSNFPGSTCSQEKGHFTQGYFFSDDKPNRYAGSGFGCLVKVILIYAAFAAFVVLFVH